MAKTSRKLKAAYAEIDRNKTYELSAAVALVKAMRKRNLTRP